MSYTRIESRADAPPRRLTETTLVRLLNLVVYAVVHAALLFAEQLAELLAPLLLLAGGIWWALPRGLDAIKLDGTAGDLLLQVRSHLPLEIEFGGHLFTPHALIYDGLLCIAIVAICRTLSNLVSVLLLERV